MSRQLAGQVAIVAVAAWWWERQRQAELQRQLRLALVRAELDGYRRVTDAIAQLPPRRCRRCRRC